MKRIQLVASVCGLSVLLGMAHLSASAADPPGRKFGMEYIGGTGSLKAPMVFKGTLKDYDRRTHKFSKRITCMVKGYQYIVKVKSYDFRPRVFLREFDNGIVARGETSSYQEKTDDGTWTVYSTELKFQPKHDEYILEISHYNDEDLPLRFALFVYKLSLDNPWQNSTSDFQGR